MINRTIKYGITVVLVVALLFSGSLGAFAGEFDWGQWLDDEKDHDVNDALTYDEMKVVSSNDRFELRLNGDNGVFYLTDKTSGAKWRSNPESWKDETIVSGTAKESLNAQLIINCYSSKQRQFVTLNSYSHSVTKGGFSFKETENGFASTYKFEDYGISVTVDYTLASDSLVVTLSKESFTDTEDYRVYDITVLPYFLSAEKSDSGYIFLPDGSGAIINLNNNKTTTEKYSAHIYGNSLNNDRYVENETKILLPVYALSKNGGTVMAVVEEGAALSKIEAAVAGQVNGVNTVFANYTLRDYAFYDAGAYGSADFDVFEKGDIKQSVYKTRYTFLSDGNTYTDIAIAFREKYIKPLSAEGEKKPEYKAVLDILGATRKIKSFFGIPIEQTEIMTSAEELSEMLSAFEGESITGLAVRYNGVSTSSLRDKLYTTLKTDRKVATKKELSALSAAETERNNKIFLTYNPVRFVKGMFTSSKRVSRDLLGQYVTLNYFSPSGVVDDGRSKTVLLRPTLLAPMTEKLAASVAGEAFGVAPSVITSGFYTDYAKGSGNAEYTVAEFKKALDSLKENRIAGDNTSFFALGYTDVDVDLPVSSSNHDLFDRSVPFYEIAVSGQKAFSYRSLNYSADNASSFLKCIETGALPKYSLYARDKSLLRDSSSTEWYNGNFSEWKSTVISQIKDYNSFAANIGSGAITAHEELAAGVYKTVFETGYGVIVNYTEKDFLYGTVTVPANDYTAIEKGVM